MAELQNGMPPGWDCKRDERSGKYYYINHYTKTTTWEDPRIRYRHLHNTPKHNQNSQSDIIPMQDMTRPRMSPLSVKSSKVQDTSLTASPEKTEEIVGKVQAMFPTVPETHIRMLLKKYHSREALVISALQVEKYPITTPGPFATPPPQRNIHQPLHATPPLGFRVNSRGGSPVCRPGSGGSPAGLRSSPRPHSSPKLKLRYMKSIFPVADEMVILDILQNNENNIQKASDSLKEMGFERKDTVKVAQQKLETKLEDERREEEKNRNIIINSQPPRVKTFEEKRRVTEVLQNKYQDMAEHLICIALESVNFDEDRANQILQIMIQEDNKTAANNKESEDVVDVLPSTSSAPDFLPVSQSRQSLKSLLKSEKELDKISFARVKEDSSWYKSPNLSNTRGPNPEYSKGANEKLLLEDYVKWQGPNTAFSQGSRQIADGPNRALLMDRTYKACGPNRGLIKGPQCGLAKGSIFSQFKAVVVGESRD